MPIQLVRQLWANIAFERRKQLSLLLMLMVLVSFAEILSIGAVLPFLGVLMSPEMLYSNSIAQPLIIFIGYEEANQLLLPMTVLFVLAALFASAMRLLLLWMEMRLGFAIGGDLSIKMYKNILYQSYSEHCNRNSSQVISAISNKTHIVIEKVLLPILRGISSIIILFNILFILILINPFIALGIFITAGGIYIAVTALAKRRLGRYGQEISRQNDRLIKTLQEGLGGIRDVLIDGTQDEYCSVYRKADFALRRSQGNIAIISGAPRYLIEFIGISAIAMLAYFLAKADDGIVVAIPVLGALAVGAQRVLPIQQQLFFSWSSIRGAQSSLKDVLGFLGEPDNDLVIEPPDLVFQNSIELLNVNFRYKEGNAFILNDVNLKIKKGCRIGFVGATGSGKSTLLDLLMGLLTPVGGDMKIDGVTITKENCRAWQKHIAHVPQSIFLADASVAENIAFGIPQNEIDHKRIIEVSHLAQIASTIESWKDKYNTIVGERGVLLSGGQRQRIGIARALYKQADVIILDEATSALDGETENSVMQGVEMLGKEITILIAAHRLSTLEKCDAIIEVSSGCVKSASAH